MKRQLVPALVLIALAIGCGSSAHARKLGAATFNDHGTKDASGQARIELEADNYYFSPTFVRGKPGQKLTLTIKNESGTTHNFSATAAGVATDIPAHGSVEIAVTLPPSGVLAFFCKYHSGQGMNGELLVGSASPQDAGSQLPGAPAPSQNVPYRAY